LGYALVGGGAVGVTVALIAGAFVLDRKSTVEAHCDPSLACDKQGVDAAQSGRTLSAVSTASFVLGAAAGGVGIYLLATEPPGRQARVPSAALVAHGTPGGSVVTLDGRF
jgi:hypothetical protein